MYALRTILIKCHQASIVIVDTYMKVQIQKWGNSLALRIPRAFAVGTNVHQGSVVEISMDAGRIVVEPIEEPEYELDALLAGVTKRNVHSEVDFGGPVGKEVW